MEFTGERYVPNRKGNIELEHRHRYLLARELCKGKMVLDLASGEGYGSAILAEVAANVVGVDISPEAVQHSSRKYQHHHNLEFMVGACAQIPLPNAFCDVVVSYETIEHHDQHEQMLLEVKRVLRPEGVLIISSPDKYHYSVVPCYKNPFHVKELYGHEFRDLLNRHFKKVIFLGQRILFGSAIFGADVGLEIAHYRSTGGDWKRTDGLSDPVYWIGIASDFRLPAIASGFLEQPIGESDTVHFWSQSAYEKDVTIDQLKQREESLQGQNGELEATLQERNDERDQLRAALGEAQVETAQLRAMLGEKVTQAIRSTLNAATARKAKLELAIDDNRRIISELRDQVVRLDTEASNLSSQLDQLVRSTSWKITGPFRILGRRLPLLARLSRRLLGPFWRRVYIVLGRSEPVIARTSVVVQTPEFFERLAVQPGLASQAEETRTPQLDTVEVFKSLQSKVGRAVILVAADALPMFDKHAGGLRLYNLVRIFCEMDWRVVFVSRFTQEYFTGMVGSPEHRKRYEDLLYDAGVEHIAYGAEEGLKLIRTLGSDLRWAFLSFPEVANEFIPAVRFHAPWADIIYDMVDFHFLRISREAEIKSDRALRVDAERMRVIELTNAKAADLTVAVSEAERKALLEIDPNLVVEVIPPFFDLLNNVRLEIDGRSGLLFVGGFWHAPNADAVLWFVNEIWPLILKERPDMIFRVVGSNPPERILALRGQAGIEVLGYVPDLTDLFAHSRMSVAPLSYGAGVKGKIGQSMAYGLPVVTTSIGAEGMALEHGKHLLIADAPEEFAAAVLRLARDDDLWRRLQANGRRFIEESQSIDAVRGKLRALIDG